MNKKILLVDDSAQIVRALKKILTEKGYIVETASDGIEAIAMLHEFKPDVLVVDLIMPKLQGDKLCKLVRSREGFRDLFIIVLSAIAAEKHVDVRSFGGDVCIAKGPFPKMKPIVLDLLERWEENPELELENVVLGLDGVYRRSITSELLAVKHHASVVLNNISDGILELTGEGKILFVNPRAALFLGRAEEDLLTTDFLSLFNSPVKDELAKVMKELPLQQEEPVDTVIHFGDRIVVANLVYLEDEYGPRIIVLFKDITSYKKIERDLIAAVHDKDVLLKEVHHRVKNNLAMVASLVNLEAENISCKEDLRILENLRSRIGSISLVHDKLYRSSDRTNLNLREFIVDLTDNIQVMSREPQAQIKIETDIPEIFVNVDMAIPLAIIVSELITNALKHAFTDINKNIMVEDPVISVCFKPESDTTYSLEVRDNGKGFDDSFKAGDSDSLGWKLVESLTDQVEGSVSYFSKGGAVVNIHLPGDMFTDSL